MGTERTWLMIRDDAVSNICRWDGDPETWQPPSGVEMIAIEDVPDGVGIGWLRVDGEWTSSNAAPAED